MQGCDRLIEHIVGQQVVFATYRSKQNAKNPWNKDRLQNQQQRCEERLCCILRVIKNKPSEEEIDWQIAENQQRPVHLVPAYLQTLSTIHSTTTASRSGRR